MWAFTDLTYVLFPVMIIWKLNMPLHRRLGLCVLMAGSIFSMVACIMRIITSHDQTLHQSALGMLWALLEQGLVIALGSAPVLASVRRLDIVKSWSASIASLVDRRSGLFSSRSRGSSGKGGSKNSGRGFPKRSKSYELGTPKSAGSDGTGDGSEKGVLGGSRGNKKFLNTVTVQSTFNMTQLNREDAQSFNSDSEHGLVDRTEVVPAYPPPVAGSRRIVVTGAAPPAGERDAGKMV